MKNNFFLKNKISFNIIFMCSLTNKRNIRICLSQNLSVLCETFFAMNNYSNVNQNTKIR